MERQTGPRIRQTKAELLASNEALSAQIARRSKSAKRSSRIISSRDGFYVNKDVLTVGGILGGAALGVLAGAAWFGGGNEGTPPGATAAPSAGESAEPSAEPSGSAAPSASASSEASASASASTETNTFVQKELKDGWKRTDMELIDGTKVSVDQFTLAPTHNVTIDAGTIISGDVNLGADKDAPKLFDTDSQIGLLVDNEKDGQTYYGTWGGTLTGNFDPSKKDTIIKTLKAQNADGGCVNGCADTVVKTVEADGSTHPYDGSQGYTQPSNAPESPATGDYNLDGMANTDKVKLIQDLFATGKVDIASPQGYELLKILVECGCTVSTCMPAETPIPSASPTSTPEVCIPGFDNDLPNKYNGNLDALKRDEKNGKEKDYLFKVNGGDVYAIQGDVEYVRDGKLHQNHDNDGSTGAVTYITMPEGESLTVYMLYGGDVHKLASCTTPAEARDIVDGYVSGMKATYNGKVKKYDVK